VVCYLNQLSGTMSPIMSAHRKPEGLKGEALYCTVMVRQEWVKTFGGGSKFCQILSRTLTKICTGFTGI
jgi:hypothetical protein